MTLEQIKEQILEEMARQISTGNNERMHHLSQVYATLCSTETMCKCPEREPFPSDFGGEM
jgi:hypothetical protein